MSYMRRGFNHAKNDAIHTIRANTVPLFKTKKRMKEIMMS